MFIIFALVGRKGNFVVSLCLVPNLVIWAYFLFFNVAFGDLV